MPDYIGVSIAVLDNVIFCHQEESLWPMSEPTILKKKFDEIFEALKWTAAVKNINDMTKTQKIELGKYQVRFEMEQVNKARGDRAEKKTIVLSDEIDKLNKDYEDLKEEIEVSLENKTEKDTLAANALTIVDKMKMRMLHRDNIQGNINNLEANMEELQDSDEWLTTTLDKYDESVAGFEKQRQNLVENWDSIQGSLSNIRQQLSRKQAELGQRQAEKENFERQIKSREQLVKDAAAYHSIRGWDGDLNEAQVAEFVSKMRRQSRDKDRELERIKKDLEDELAQLQLNANKIDNQKSTRTADRMRARQAIEENKKSVERKKVEANAIDMDELRKGDIELAKSNAQKRLSTLSSDFDTANWDKQIQIENQHRLELEAEEGRLMDEYRRSTKLSSDRAQLEYIQKQAKETRRQLDVLKSTNRARLSNVLGADWRWDNLAQEFATVESQRADAVRDAKKAQEGIQQQLKELDFKLKTSRSSRAQKKSEIEKRKTIVLSSTTTVEDGKALASIDDYPKELQNWEEYCQELQQGLDGNLFVMKYYNQCRETAIGNNACQLCERPFADKKERTLAVEKISKQLAKSNEEYLKGVLMTAKQDRASATAARSDYEVYKTLSLEISGLDKDVNDYELSKVPLVKVLESHDNKVLEEQAAQEELADLALVVKKFVEQSTALAKHEAEISSSLPSQNTLTGNIRTPDEVDEQLSGCKERLAVIKVKIDKLSNDKEHAKSTIITLQNEISGLSNQLSAAGHQLEKKNGILSDIAELRRNDVKQRATMSEVDADLEALSLQEMSANSEIERARNIGKAKERDAHSEQRKLADTVGKFDLAQQAIDTYIENGGPDRLAACQRSIKSLEQDQVRFEGEEKQVATENNQIKKRIDDSERTRRSIIDNIQYRKHRKELVLVNDEISQLEAQNGNQDYEHLRRQADRAQEQYDLLCVRRGAMLASINHKDLELAEAIQLWNTDYKDAAQNYRESRIKVETTKAAMEDLGKYSKALDAAILKYHSIKMEEINQVAGELWRQTYQGSDVDTIMIKSEAENVTAKRNINYRVVMVKSGSEMDMRGRCSAGQKVLACIVIRLALAECFGVNCGVSTDQRSSRDQLITCLRLSLLTSLPRTLMTITSEPLHNPSTKSSRPARLSPTFNLSSSLTTRLSSEK